MVYKCSVPRCPTGSTQNRTKEKVSMHKFPTDPGLLEKWMKSIPRKNWTPSKHSFICSLHFHEENFVKSTMDSNTRRKNKRKESLLKRYLKKDAIPTIFRQLPSYLSKEPTPARSNTATTSSRMEAENLRLQHANDLFLKSTQVKTLAELQKKMLNEVIPEGIKTVHYGDKQVYVYFDFQSGFKAIFSLVVYQDLTINVYINGKHLSSKHFSHLMSGKKISDACTLCNILAFVKAESENSSEHSLGVNAIIQELEQAVQDSTSLESTTTGRLLFLIEQLKLTLLSPCSRR